MLGGAEEVCLVILEGKFEGISWSAILDGRRVEVCRYWMECFFVDDVRRVEENYASRGSSKGELSSGVVRTSDSYTSLHTVPSHDHLHTGQERLQQDRARYCSSRSKSSRIFIKLRKRYLRYVVLRGVIIIAVTWCRPDSIVRIITARVQGGINNSTFALVRCNT